jgi:ABC-2 type transport system permease protein
MKTIFKIARLELATLFYSPVAWLALIIFVGQCGLELLSSLVDTKKYLLETGFHPDITLLKISRGYEEVYKYLYVYIPLLSMGLFSREINSGSIKLVLSSPIRIRSIVFGKFLGVVSYCSLFILALIALTLVADIAIINADTGLMLSGIFGLFLISLLYCAVGLFMSSLTSYQLIAAIGTFFVLMTLEQISAFGAGVDGLRDGTNFLSVFSKKNDLMQGLIRSSDVFYFLLMSAFFLALTIFVLLSGRESRPWYVKFGRYALAIGVLLMLGYLTSWPTYIVYYDATDSKDNTVTKNTRDVLQSLNEPLKLHAYVNIFDDKRGLPLTQPRHRNADKAFFEPYQRFLKYPIQYEYTYYYDSITKPAEASSLLPQASHLSMRTRAEAICYKYGLDVDELLRPGQLKGVPALEFYGYNFVREFSCGGRKSYLGLVSNENPREGNIAAALKQLTEETPIIGMLSGHGERDPFEAGDREFSHRYSNIFNYNSLVNHGLNIIQKINLDTVEEIPKSLAFLVIADPFVPYSGTELQKIQHFINDGGNLVIAADTSSRETMQNILNPLGVKIRPGVMLRESDEYPPSLIIADTATGTLLLKRSFRNYEKAHHIVGSGTMGLDYKSNASFEIKPFLVSNKLDTWSRLTKFDMDSSKIAFNPVLGDTKETVPLAVTLTKHFNNKQQRIVVFGDADFLSNEQNTTAPPKRVNVYLMLEVSNWLTYGKFPIDVYRPSSKDTDISMSLDMIKMFRTIFVWVIPGLLLVGGACFLFRRRIR